MKVFLCYRRADSQAVARLMNGYFLDIDSVDEVFIDLDRIAPGEDFEHCIELTLASATDVFVLIGPQWAGPPGANGRTRLFDADDMVRRELQRSLASAARVVPVLIDGTPLPAPAALPPELQPLLRRNAFTVRTARFEDDMDDLLDVLIGGTAGRHSRWRAAPLGARGVVARLGAGVAAGALLLLVILLLNRLANGPDVGLVQALQKLPLLGDEADASALAWLIIVTVFGLALLAPFRRRWRTRRR